MGLVAPVAAVLGAAIPSVATAFAEGFPGYRHLLGFILAGVGVWLISRTEAGVGRPEGLGLAVLAGIGFAGFYLCIHRAGNGSALWIATCSRFGALLVTGSIVAVRKTPARGGRTGAGHCHEWLESSISPAAPSSSARLKSDAWTRRLCSVRSIPRLRFCWLASFCTNTSAAPGPSGWSRRWRRCR